MARPMVIWGATGQARVLVDFLPALDFRVVAFVDREPAVPSPLPGVPVLLGESGFREWIRAHPSPAALVAIGGERGGDRLQLQALLRDAGCSIATAIHPRAIVAGNARIGEGSQVLAGAIVGAGASIGAGVILNSGASADHDCVLGDGVHLAPGTTLCGEVRIGALTLVGAGAVVCPRITIGGNSVVGAGSVVTRNIPDNVIAYGNPARIISVRTPAGATP